MLLLTFTRRAAVEMIRRAQLIIGKTGKTGAETLKPNGVANIPWAAVGFGVAAAKPALVFYLAAYAATTLGAFAVASWLGRKGNARLHVDDWAGLTRKRPVLALVMTLFLLSLSGVPPTGGSSPSSISSARWSTRRSWCGWWWRPCSTAFGLST